MDRRMKIVKRTDEICSKYSSYLINYVRTMRCSQFCKFIRTVLILTLGLYLLLTHIIFGNSRNTAPLFVYRSDRKVAIDLNNLDLPEKFTPSSTPENKPVKDMITITMRYWELIQHSNSKSYNFSDKPNISEFALAIDSLWPEMDSSLPAHDRILEQLIFCMEAVGNPSINQLKTKRILLYDSFRWWNFKGNEEFRLDCPGFGNKCEFLDGPSSDSKFLTRAEVDAVITAQVPGSRTENLHLTDDVLQFFYLLESSFHTRATLRRGNDLLASYYRNSHLVTPYAKWVYYNQSIKRQKQKTNYATGKTKLVAAIMSNCLPANHRLFYVHQLQKFMNVDVYGACGSLECPENCLGKIKNEYKFYLSFENSNCRDYITEKFFNNALSNNMIPIVMGAHPSDYRTGAPENSYIHVEDFQNPKELAEYLLYLDKHDSEYNKYFEWIGLGEFVDAKFLCRACALTHYADFVPPPDRDEVFIWEDVNQHKLCFFSDSKHPLYWKNYLLK